MFTNNKLEKREHRYPAINFTCDGPASDALTDPMQSRIIDLTLYN